MTTEFHEEWQKTGKGMMAHKYIRYFFLAKCVR